MSTPPDDTFGEGPTNQDGSDDKEQVAEAFRNAGVVSEEDQTRSTLHYGNDEDGTLSKTDPQGGWGHDGEAPNLDDQTHGSDKVEVAGEPLTALGNDYQCNQRGGPPRNRDAQAGELFILDLGPAYRGYYADNCRTFSVDRSPTETN